jgi:LuxR family maltose regulon positive regulatory protein
MHQGLLRSLQGGKVAEQQQVASEPSELLSAHEVAEEYEMRGQLRKLEQFFQRQQDEESSLFSILLRGRQAMLFYEWNRLEEANALAQRVLEMGKRLDFVAPTVPIISLWTRVRVALARNEQECAIQLMQEADLDPTRWSAMGWGGILMGSSLVRLQLRLGWIDEAERWDGAKMLSFDDQLSTVFIRSHYTAYVTLARLLLARGRIRHSTQALEQASILLDHLLEIVSAMHADGYMIETQILQAMVFQAQGKIKRALSRLGEALTRAEAEGYLRLFVDEGPSMALLLAQVAEYTSASQRYLQRLQAAFPPIGEKQRSEQSLPEPLSEREMDVLQLLAEGLSNQQIAERLVISLHTVKIHVKHIFVRLSVTNRTQAVTYARMLHLL